MVYNNKCTKGGEIKMKLSYISKAKDLNKKLEFLRELFGDVTLKEVIKKINA